MGEVQKFLCDGCSGCQALPLNKAEYRAIYAESKIAIDKRVRDRAIKLLTLKAYIVFCHQHQERMIVII